MRKVKEIILAVVLAIVCCWVIEKAAESTGQPQDSPAIKIRLETGALHFREIR